MSLTALIWDADGRFHWGGRSQTSKHRETKRKCILLTYLLSFFSGGDFLSHPWKMISPPLMFACVLLLALKLQSVNSAWRILRARLLKVRSAFVSSCSLLPPFDENQSTAGRRCSQSFVMALCEPTGVQNSATGFFEKVRTASWRRAAGKLYWCRARKYQRVSAVCFPNSHHAHSAKRGMGCWDEQDGRTACRKTAPRHPDQSEYN